MGRRITASEVRAKLQAVLDDVEAGEEVEITRRGRTSDRATAAIEGGRRAGRRRPRPHHGAPAAAPLAGRPSTVVRTVPISPAIAATAAGLSEAFPRDPADRLVYATAVEHGLPLVTKDQRLRRPRRGGAATVW